MGWLIGTLAVVAGAFLLSVLFGAPYVPTHKKQLIKLIGQLDLSLDDVLVDCGAGDGLVGRAFAKHIKRAVGYEINPFLVLIAKIANRNYPKNKVKLADFRRANWPIDTTVVYYFGAAFYAQQLVEKVKAQSLEHHHPLTIISYGFELPNLGEPQMIAGFNVYQI